MRAITGEIASQPALWRKAAGMAPAVTGRLPAPGEPAAAIGCGTSYHIAQAYATLREDRGLGTTDAAIASELSLHRSYRRVVAISRSGTTTEVVRTLQRLKGSVATVAVTAVPDSPIASFADDVIVLDFANEQSVVQTRFATTVLALLRAHTGDRLDPAFADGEVALGRALPVEPSNFKQFVFLGQGWTVGLANEAALKLREAAAAWTEAYPAMEYRHGPISLAGPGTLVWAVGPVDPGVLADAANTGAIIVDEGSDPMAELVLIQRMAVQLAEAGGLDPDRPKHLTRSVVLP
ncbi:MAG TPA: SIS domain-containing protein [Streptosporangiaceae bacterium]|jgi:fructoselysine-6-P-deglycase FrlB-like protein|nr:SIS domain-containing protein [Streptosporangiaceae bacterium]